MPSPKFSFRLPEKDKESLLEMSKIYGAQSPGAFCAEMVGALCSGEVERVKAFVARLVARTGEQTVLNFNAALDAVVEPQKSTPKRKTLRRGGQEPPKRGRRS